MQPILWAIPAAVLGMVILTGGVTAADKPKPPEPGKNQPAETPLEVTLDGTAKYTLAADAPSEDDLKKGFATDKFPNPPKVDLKVVIKNTSDKAVKVWASGDPVTLDLKLTGKGAVHANPRLMMTREFRLPKAVEIEAGKTAEIPLKQLSGGLRGMGEYWYWTKAGEYELTAVLHTGVSPAPKGAEAADGGFGKVLCATKPLKITVEEKK